MRALIVGACVLATGCNLYVDEDDPGPSQCVDLGCGPGGLPAYTLVPRGNVAAPGAVHGVAWDGQEHWLVTRTEVGGYWDPDVLEIFRFDVETATASPPIVLTDHWERPTGAAWIDGRLWIHYDANDGGRVMSLDPATGVERDEFAVGPIMGDLDTDGARLFLGNVTTEADIEVRDVGTGTIVDELWTPLFGESLRGLAVVTPEGATAPEVWGGTLRSGELAILVDNQPVAHAAVPGFGSNNWWHFQFAGQRLTAVTDNQLYLFDVVRP